jgi:hypothetical protein
MLSKVTRSASQLSSGLRSATILVHGPKRNFSIEEIGKRYEKPYDYTKKRYGLLGQFFDSTLKKLGENSLIITVEGNFGSGKTEFARQLAKNIDFVYAREPDLDYHAFVDPETGENRRELINNIVGQNEMYHVDNLEDWHSKPTFRGAIQLQHLIYNIRFMQTRQALLHLFSTGMYFRELYSESFHNFNFSKRLYKKLRMQLLKYDCKFVSLKDKSSLVTR